MRGATYCAVVNAVNRCYYYYYNSALLTMAFLFTISRVLNRDRERGASTI
jgi:hypothetical protein